MVQPSITLSSMRTTWTMHALKNGFLFRFFIDLKMKLSLGELDTSPRGRPGPTPQSGSLSGPSTGPSSGQLSGPLSSSLTALSVPGSVSGSVYASGGSVYTSGTASGPASTGRSVGQRSSSTSPRSQRSQSQGQGYDSDDELSALEGISGAKESLALRKYFQLRKDSKSSMVQTPTSSSVHGGYSKADRFSPPIPGSQLQIVTPYESLRSVSFSTSPRPFNFTSSGASTIKPDQQVNDTTAMRALLKTALGEKSEMAKKVEFDEKTINAMRTNLAIASNSTSQYASLVKIANRNVLPRCLFHLIDKSLLARKHRAFKVFAWGLLQYQRSQILTVRFRCGARIIAVLVVKSLKHCWARWSRLSRVVTKKNLILQHDIIVTKLLSPRLPLRLFRLWRARTAVRLQKKKLLRKLIVRCHFAHLREAFSGWKQHLHLSLSSYSLQLKDRLWLERFRSLFMRFFLRADVSVQKLRNSWALWRSQVARARHVDEHRRSILTTAMTRLNAKVSLSSMAFRHWRRQSLMQFKRFSPIWHCVTRIFGAKDKLTMMRRLETWKRFSMNFSHSILLRRHQRLSVLSQTVAVWRVQHSCSVQSSRELAAVKALLQLGSIFRRQHRVQLFRALRSWYDCTRMSRVQMEHQQLVSSLQSKLDYVQRDCQSYAHELQGQVDSSHELSVKLQETTRSFSRRLRLMSATKIRSFLCARQRHSVFARFSYWRDVCKTLIANRRIKMLRVVHSLLRCTTTNINIAFSRWKAVTQHIRSKINGIILLWTRCARSSTHRAFNHWKLHLHKNSQARIVQHFRNATLRRTIVHQWRMAVKLSFCKWKYFPAVKRLKSRVVTLLSNRIAGRTTQSAWITWKQVTLVERQRALTGILFYFKSWGRYNKYWNQAAARFRVCVSKWQSRRIRGAFAMWTRLVLQLRASVRFSIRLYNIFADRRIQSVRRRLNQWKMLLIRSREVYIHSLDGYLVERNQDLKLLKDQLETFTTSHQFEVDSRQRYQFQSESLEKIAQRLFQNIKLGIRSRQLLVLQRTVFLAWKQGHVKSRHKNCSLLLSLKFLVRRAKMLQLFRSFSQWIACVATWRRNEDRCHKCVQAKKNQLARKIFNKWWQWGRSTKQRRLADAKLVSDAETDKGRRLATKLNQRCAGLKVGNYEFFSVLAYNRVWHRSWRSQAFAISLSVDLYCYIRQ
jgi:hypothetical protein